ncbi:hypothetical protein BJ546DRAFT_311697 [Cryomyces antarcticus]
MKNHPACRQTKALAIVSALLLSSTAVDAMSGSIPALASSRTPIGVKVRFGWCQKELASTTSPPLTAKKACSIVHGWNVFVRVECTPKVELVDAAESSRSYAFSIPDRSLGELSQPESSSPTFLMQMASTGSSSTVSPSASGDGHAWVGRWQTEQW